MIDNKNLLLSDILNSDEDTLIQLRKQLIQKGWAFVKMSEDLISLIQQVIDPVEQFFKQSLKQKKKI